MDNENKPTLSRSTFENDDSAEALDVSTTVEREPTSTDLLESTSEVEAETPITTREVAKPVAIEPPTERNTPAITLAVILALVIIAGAIGAFFAKSNYDSRITQQSAEINRLHNASSEGLKKLEGDNKTLTDENKKLEEEKTTLTDENKKLSDDKAELEKQNKTLTEQLETASKETRKSTTDSSSENRTSSTGTNRTKPSTTATDKKD